MPGVQHFVDLRVCAGSATCFATNICQPGQPCCVSFSSPTDGSCTGASPSNTFTAANASYGSLLLWADAQCSTPNPGLAELPITLDGQCHTVMDDAVPISYSGALRSACLAPDPTGANYYSIDAVSASRFQDAGNYDACVGLTDFQYCILQGHAPVDGLFVGVCVPRGCTAADLTNPDSSIFQWMATQVNHHGLLPLPSDVGLFLAEFGSSATTTVRCGDQSYHPASASASGVLAGLLCCAALVLLATVHTLMYPRRSRGAKGGRREAQGFLDVVHASSLCTTGRRIFCLSGGAAAPRPAALQPPPAYSLAAMDGMRVLSLCLVILGHAFFFPNALLGYTNTALGFGPIAAELAKASLQVIPSAEFAVDTFFMLSGALGGLLLTQGFKRALARARVWPLGLQRAQGGASSSGDEGPRAALLGSSLNDGAEASAASAPLPLPSRLLHGAAVVAQVWGYALVHRYLRLLPSVALLIAASMFLMPLLGYGPFWRYGMEGSYTACKDHAWTNLLFVNNYFPGQAEGRFDNQCVGWTWYLACDMQLHALALPPLALAAAFSPLLGWPALLAALAGTIGRGGSSIVRYSLTPLVFGGAPSLMGDSSDYFYDQPLERAPAFLIGVGLGWALLRVEAAAGAAAAKAAEAAAAPAAQPQGEEEEEGGGQGGRGGGRGAAGVAGAPVGARAAPPPARAQRPGHCALPCHTGAGPCPSSAGGPVLPAHQRLSGRLGHKWLCRRWPRALVHCCAAVVHGSLAPPVGAGLRCAALLLRHRRGRGAQHASGAPNVEAPGSPELSNVLSVAAVHPWEMPQTCAKLLTTLPPPPPPFFSLPPPTSF